MDARFTSAIAMIVGAYLVGSIPFGLIVGLARGVDVRKAGSGNIGATNVGRVLGRGYGVAVFVLDTLKGLVPVFLAGRVLGGHGARGGPLSSVDCLLWIGVAAACILGHVFPVYLRFKGGKGVATSLGVLLGIYPYYTVPGLMVFGLWVVVTGLTRYVSVGSMTAAAAFPVVFALAAHRYRASWGTVDELWPMYVFAVVIAGLVIYRHRGNLARRLTGTESKIGSSQPTGSNRQKA